MKRILQNQSGVSEIQADPAVHHVTLTVDKEQVDREALLLTLQQGGYPAEVIVPA